MGNVATGTVCPFPFTFANESDLTIESCTKTYAEALDPAFLIMQIAFFILFGLVFLPPFVLRLIKLNKYSRATGKNLFELVQFKLYVLGVLICLGVVLEMVDPLGFRNLSIYMYYVVDEVVAACIFVVALTTVEFYLDTANESQGKGKVPKTVFWLATALTFINFVGVQVAGMLLPEYYGICEAVKLYGAGVILMVYLAIAAFARREILKILHTGNRANSLSSADMSLKASLAWRYPENVTGTQRAILTTKRKFCEWMTIVIVAFFAVMGVGTLALDVAEDVVDHTWSVPLSGFPEIGFVAFKILYIIVPLVILRLFAVPVVRSSSMTSKDSKTGTLKTATDIGETEMDI